MTTFKELGLAETLLHTLEREGYQAPTPIQQKAIPIVLSGADVLGIAQTGTGKTAAFALPIIHKLGANPKAPMRKGCRVLVLSPTRELATQIAESFRTYRGTDMRFGVTTIFGGVGYKPQIQAMARGVDVLVATPGRLIDHLEQRTVDLSGVEILVLDEADQMLDLGFVKPIRKIAALLSAKRQSLFFSATMPPEIRKLASELLREPKEVSVAPTSTTVERVAQRVIHVERAKKRALLVELFGDKDMTRTLVFTRTKRGADRVGRHLENAGIDVGVIHGDKSQKARQDAIEALRASEIRVLVATDIAARGIDIDGVSHVVNFELPDVPESYVHRIGRTARAGAAGIAISLVDQDERGQLRDIERVTRQKLLSEDRRGDADLKGDSGADDGDRRSGAGRSRSGGERGGGRSFQRETRAPARTSEGQTSTAIRFGASGEANVGSVDGGGFRKPQVARKPQGAAGNGGGWGRGDRGGQRNTDGQPRAPRPQYGEPRGAERGFSRSRRKPSSAGRGALSA